MRKKLERWLAKKLKMKPEDVMLDSISLEYTFINSATMEMTRGKRTISVRELN